MGLLMGLPGTFFFTVSDNGVTSKEFWRVLDCDEGYEWWVRDISNLVGYNEIYQ